MREKLIELMRNVKNACARRWAEFVASQKTCDNCAHRGKTDADPPCCRCFGGDEWEAPKTNGDRIRAMSDEELAKLLFDMQSCGDVEPDLLDWLKQLAEVEV